MSDSDSSSGSPRMGLRVGLRKRCSNVDEFEEKEVKERAMSECLWEYGRGDKGSKLLAHEGAVLLKEMLNEAVVALLPELDNSSKGRYSGKRLFLEVRERAEDWDVGKITEFTTEGGCYHYSEKGPRAMNEDRCAFVPDLKLITSLPFENCIYTAVFDGHNGTDAAETAKQLLHHFIAQHLMSIPAEEPPTEQAVKAALTAAFRDTHRTIVGRSEWNGTESGTTATICLIVNGVLYTSNVGDSRAVLIRNGKPIVLTQAHHVTNEDEVASVKKRGGDIIKVHGIPMVNGRIQVTRTLGFSPCESVLSQVPDISRHTLSPDDIVVLATDGLWDVMSPEEVLGYTSASLQPAAPRNLAAEALSRGSTDNVTVILLRFK